MMHIKFYILVCLVHFLLTIPHNHEHLSNRFEYQVSRNLLRDSPRHRSEVRRPRSHASRGPIFFFMVEVYIEIFGFLREYIAKFTERPQTLTL